MQILGPANVPSKDALIESLRAPLNLHVSQNMRPVVEPDRQQMLATIRRSHLYLQGKQHLALISTSPGALDYYPMRCWISTNLISASSLPCLVPAPLMFRPSVRTC